MTLGNSKLAQIKIGLAIARLGLSAIANDTYMECRCGEHPYTDGELCPRCTAANTLEYLNIQCPVNQR